MTVNIMRSFIITQEAEKMLQKTINKTPACVETIESVRDAVDSGEGLLFLITENDDLLGVMFANFVPNPNKGKDIFNVVLFSAKKFKKWKYDLWNFVMLLLKQTNAQLVLVTRKGWGKIYPLKEVGSVYTYAG